MAKLLLNEKVHTQNIQCIFVRCLGGCNRCSVVLADYKPFMVYKVKSLKINVFVVHAKRFMFNVSCTAQLTSIQKTLETWLLKCLVPNALLDDLQLKKKRFPGAKCVYIGLCILKGNNRRSDWSHRGVTTQTLQMTKTFLLAKLYRDVKWILLDTSVCVIFNFKLRKKAQTAHLSLLSLSTSHIGSATFLQNKFIKKWFWFMSLLWFKTCDRWPMIYWNS